MGLHDVWPARGQAWPSKAARRRPPGSPRSPHNSIRANPSDLVRDSQQIWQGAQLDTRRPVRRSWFVALHSGIELAGAVRESLGARLARMPRIACDPTTTNSSAPVIAALARITCSSSCRLIANSTLDRPHLARRENPDERRIVSQSNGFVVRSREDADDVWERPPEQLSPLGVAAHQPVRLAVALGPAIQVAFGEQQPLRPARKLVGDPPRQLEAHAIVLLVGHGRVYAAALGRKNGAPTRRAKGGCSSGQPRLVAARPTRSRRCHPVLDRPAERGDATNSRLRHASANAPIPPAAVD